MWDLLCTVRLEQFLNTLPQNSQVSLRPRDISSFRVWGSNKASSLPFCARAYNISVNWQFLKRWISELNIPPGNLKYSRWPGGNEEQTVASKSTKKLSFFCPAPSLENLEEHTRPIVWREDYWTLYWTLMALGSMGGRLTPVGREKSWAGLLPPLSPPRPL